MFVIILLWACFYWLVVPALYISGTPFLEASAGWFGVLLVMLAWRMLERRR